MFKFLTPYQIAQVVKIDNPLDWCVVTQPFGVNYVDFYTKLGMKGHNGIDLRITRGQPCYAIIDGEVIWADERDGYGIHVVQRTGEFEYGGVKFYIEVVYGHLQDVSVKKGQKIMAGTVVGHCDNTGKYTTGDHLHLGVRPIYKKGGLEPNGYFGYIDPSRLFIDKGWNWLPVEKRYGRYYERENPHKRPNHALISEYKVSLNPYVWKRLRRAPTLQEVKAMTYGGWDIEAIENPAMFPTWATLKKDEFLAGKSRPIRLTAG